MLDPWACKLYDNWWERNAIKEWQISSSNWCTVHCALYTMHYHLHSQSYSLSLLSQSCQCSSPSPFHSPSLSPSLFASSFSEQLLFLRAAALLIFSASGDSLASSFDLLNWWIAATSFYFSEFSARYLEHLSVLVCTSLIKNSKCHPVSKYWRLELFWWELLCNLILKKILLGPVKKTTLYYGNGRYHYFHHHGHHGDYYYYDTMIVNVWDVLQVQGQPQQRTLPNIHNKDDKYEKCFLFLFI